VVTNRELLVAILADPEVKGVRSGLPSLGSGALRPNRTGPNH